MLVRALKMLSYFRNETARIDTATAALISRAMKAALMAEAGSIGNGGTVAFSVVRQTEGPGYWPGRSDMAVIALSSEVDTGSREENASEPKL
jgi:hypothetical protein